MNLIEQTDNKVVFEQELKKSESMFGNLNFTKLGYYFVQTSPTLDISATNVLVNGKYMYTYYNFPRPDAKKIKITIEIVE